MTEDIELLKRYDYFQFENDMKELGVILDKKQICQFLKFYELLVEWNSFMNLTAITDYEEVMKKHFVDSLTLIRVISDKSLSQCSLIDVGTGAGFPGIPLKIAFPHIQVTLLDSLNKRVTFLNEVIKELGLIGIYAVHGRAEDLAKPGKLREKFDICVSRAVANLSTLSEYCLPFVKKGGIFVSYKSEKLTDELKKAEKAVTILGGAVVSRNEFTLPSSDILRNLLVIEKKKEAPLKYPRKAGLPSKEPI